MERILVIGIGRMERGDDAAGRLVVRALAGRLPPVIELREETGEAAHLLECMAGRTVAHLVDACRSGAEPGTIRRFDVSAAPLPRRDFELSTHGLGLVEAIGLARALDQLPRRCLVHAIEGECFDLGAPPSPRVAAAIEELARRLEAELTAGGKADARNRSGS